MYGILKSFIELFKDSTKDVLPIVAVIAFFQIFIFQAMPSNLAGLIVGMLIVIFGLSVFIKGLEIGIFPLGESLAHKFAKKGSVFWLLFFSFLIGFATTVAEPALIAIADKAAAISEGKIDADYLRLTVALSVGFAIALGTLRILLGHPIHYYIITGYVLVVALTYITPPEIVGLAYDSGGVTTSTVTVPLVAALGIGLASSIRGRNPVIDGFGLIAFASLTPMIFVQVYGILAISGGEAPAPAQAVAETIQAAGAPVQTTEPLSLKRAVLELFSVMGDVLPILGVMVFFQYFILKEKIPNLPKIIIGFSLVILGLDAFIIGLEAGLFPLGDEMAAQLTTPDAQGLINVYLIYLFAFMIGFSTTMAEPSLLAVAIKANEISRGQIDTFVLRAIVAVGVAVGIALGSYRIVQGDPIHYYIIAGYIVVIIQTFFAPRWIVPIAYDSGGVTTSTVTVPLVTALGLGLAGNIPGRSVLVDGFGLIAFASLFPMITVMGYGTYAHYRMERLKKQEQKEG